MYELYSHSMFSSKRKITGGEVVVTDSDVYANKITGGAVVISGGSVDADVLTGGGVVLARDSINIKRVHAAGGPISAPNITVEEGSPSIMDAEEILEDDRKMQYMMGKYSNYSYEKVRSILNIDTEQKDETDASTKSDGKNEGIDEFIPATEMKDKMEDRNDNGSSELVSANISDQELAVVVVAEVLGLLSEDDEQYNRDRLILLEQYPELESIVEQADSVENVTQMAEEIERLEFSNSQIQLMRKYQDKLGSNEDVSLAELEY